jgi:organic radical activating enzyme
MLRVNEIFGPTIQGEGKYAGRHCMFVRLYDCNLQCSWCDTPYTWANTNARAAAHRDLVLFPKEENFQEKRTLDVLWDLDSYWPIRQKPTIIVVSGGEPLLQMHGLTELAESVTEWANEVHIETAGTIKPTNSLHPFIEAYTVSPKLENSGNLLKKRYKPDVIDWFAGTPKATFKFVVSGITDLDEVDQMVEAHAIHPSRVYCMPEGTSAARNIAVAKRVAASVIEKGYGLSFRSHTLIWENERRR